MNGLDVPILKMNRSVQGLILGKVTLVQAFKKTIIIVKIITKV